MKLFIDDVRFPHDVNLKDEDWEIARSYDEALLYIEEFKPQRIAFDHDLGAEHYHGKNPNQDTGLDVAKWLVKMDMDHPEAGYITEASDFSCHSANPAGKANILKLLHAYKCDKFYRNPQQEKAHVQH